MPRPHQDSRNLRGPRVVEFNTAGAGSTVVPYGAIYLTVVLVGGGGGGGGSDLGGANGGGGGGSGGASINSYAIRSDDWGKTISFSIGAGGSGGASGSNGTNGGSTTLTSIVLNGVATGTLTANNGVTGTPTGSGGPGGGAGTSGSSIGGKPALGGEATGRVAGTDGTAGTASDGGTGGNSPIYGDGGGISALNQPAFLPGAGGAGGGLFLGGTAGAPGEVRFYWYF